MAGTYTGNRAGLEGSTSPSLTDKAGTALEGAAGTIKETGGELRHGTADRIGSVAHKVADKADTRRSEMADTARAIQEKAQEFARNIAEEQPQVGKAIEQVSNSAGNVVSYVERTPVEEMTKDLSAQVRRHPLLFAAGLFGAGFALSRALKPVDPSAVRASSMDRGVY
ncbi:MAG: hypothetical protein JWM90_2415 [Thermoleophilia bacterium]|nr:hypothetical protein [Thermoleophilia bacterium]